MSERSLFIVLTATTGACAGAASAGAGLLESLVGRATGVAAGLRQAIGEQRAGLQLFAAAGVATALAGFSLLGAAGALVGAAAGPLVARGWLRGRRGRYAARIDDCAADLAIALASALAGGHSLRAALAGAGRSLSEPLASELDRACVDLALGRPIGESLEQLRRRTGSRRIAALAAAIELQRGSGGDLIGMMRELAAAFRMRDVARRDARTATAQARYTAIVVAAIPLTIGLIAELAHPGSVSGAFAFAPTAVVMVIAVALLGGGSLLCVRIGQVR